MMKHLALITTVFSGLLLLGAPQAFAQEKLDDIENLFSKEDEAPAAEPASRAEQKATTSSPAEVADLGRLEPFDDVAVIQKRYLPKTQRFEFFVGPSLIMNDAFFLNFGLSGRLGYHFSERYSLEFLGTFLTGSERQVTTDLRKRGVSTASFVTPQSFFGLDFKWSPIYGKMGWRDKKITPFDHYFSLGGGMTGLIENDSVPTLHLGTGQVYALGKSSAIRWDFTWNMFQATSKIDASRKSSLYHNLYLTIGMSFFFPEATYR